MSKRFRGYLERFLGSRQWGAVTESSSDSDLLLRFAATGDQDAFELLVWRHGMMVLGVCQRLIRDAHLAEDAFQASFLILAKKARSIRGGNVAGWLYRVTRRVAERVSQNRPDHRELPEIAIESDTNRIDSGELTRVLDDEIGRLPERLRRPVLLCYLGGRSTEEAARELDCPRGTILSRLSTARKRLATSLGRRGVALSAVLPALGMELNGRIVSATTVAALRFLTCPSPLDPVSLLAQGVVQTMSHYKQLTLLSVLVLATGLIGGVGWVAAKSGSDEQGSVENQDLAQVEGDPQAPESKKADLDDNATNRDDPIPEIKDSDEMLDILKLDPVFRNAMKSDEKDTPIRKLQKEMCRELALYQAKIERAVAIGRWNASDLPEAMRNAVILPRAFLELMDRPADKLKCHEMEVRNFKAIERFTDLRVIVGTDPSQNHNLVKAARLEAEIKLLKFKSEMEKAKTVGNGKN